MFLEYTHFSGQTIRFRIIKVPKWIVYVTETFVLFFSFWK